MSKKSLDLPVLIALILIGIASLIGINQYHFGMWNQFIALPWLYDLMDPTLYPNDPLIAQRVNSPSFYNMALAKIAGILGNDVAITHFIIYVMVLILTLLSFYQLSWQIFKNKNAALFTVVLLTFSFPVIGTIAVWDSVLMERTITLPILLFSVVFMLQKRWLWTVLIQALAFNIHPLSSLYLIVCSWIGVIFWMQLKGRYYLYWPLFLILVIPVLYLRHLHPSDSSAIVVSELWMKIMHLRNAHHSFPSTFSLKLIINSILIALVYIGILWRSDLDSKLKKFFSGFGVGILMLLIIGTIFTEIIPVRIIIQLQFFRSFIFLVLFTIILWSGLIIRKPQVWLMILGIGVIIQYFYGVPSKSFAFLAVAVASFFLIRKTAASRWLQSLGTAAIILVVGIAGYWQRDGLKIRQGRQKQSWYDLQHWSRENTARDVVFIEPPSQAGFRVESLRSSYGTWHDGTKAFFSEAYGELWWARMSSLGCTDPDSLVENYKANKASDFQAIWENLDDQYSEAYVICFDDMALPEFDLVYSNEDFKVYRL